MEKWNVQKNENIQHPTKQNSNYLVSNKISDMPEQGKKLQTGKKNGQWKATLGLNSQTHQIHCLALLQFWNRLPLFSSCAGTKSWVFQVRGRDRGQGWGSVVSCRLHMLETLSLIPWLEDAVLICFHNEPDMAHTKSMGAFLRISIFQACFLTSSTGTGEFARNPEPWDPPLDRQNQNLLFNKLPRWFIGTFKCEKHCFKTQLCYKLLTSQTRRIRGAWAYPIGKK